MRTRALRRRSGVTMVEVLVAAALTVALVSLFITLITSATSGVSSARGISEIDAKVRNATTILRDDLSHVWLGTKSLGQIFSVPPSLPVTEDQGYFSIEENSPACTTGASTLPTAAYLRQGVDQRGVPVEIDTDDVLAFTVRRNGTSQAGVYVGQVPFNSFLDLQGAKGRFDDLQANGVHTSRFAEVVYFLRPNRRQPTLGDVTVDTANPATNQNNPTSIVTYTLYRRQLLILEPAYADAMNTSQPAVASVAGGATFYQLYDVSAHWDASNSRMVFHTIKDLRKRQYRFGLFPNAASATDDTRWLPFAAFPSVDVGTANRLHDWGTATQEPWFGRPTLAETTAPAFDLASLTTGSAITDANADGVVDTLASTVGRAGEDVLLTNVLSFDVKVYDDDNGEPYAGAFATRWPTGLAYPGTDLHRTTPVNLLQVGINTGTQNTPPDFVDLGFRGQAEPLSLWTGSIGTATDWSTIMAGFSPIQVPARWRSLGQTGRAAGADFLLPSTYDTMSFNTVTSEYPIAASGTNIQPPPYARPMRGIQIKLRVLEPKTSIVREATIIQSFE